MVRSKFICRGCSGEGGIHAADNGNARCLDMAVLMLNMWVLYTSILKV